MADIQTLINAIPDAQDGNVITADYHNTIKTALTAIAGQLGPQAGGRTVVQNLMPAFLPVPPISSRPAWNVSVGSATDVGGTLTDGWLPLYLPDGAIIQQLNVIGVKTAATTEGTYSATVNLNILPIGPGNGPTLITIALDNVMGNPFQTAPGQGQPSLAGTSATSLKDLQTVKNSQNKYIIRATVNPSPAPGTLTINALQVTYQTTD